MPGRRGGAISSRPSQKHTILLGGVSGAIVGMFRAERSCPPQVDATLRAFHAAEFRMEGLSHRGPQQRGNEQCGGDGRDILCTVQGATRKIAALDFPRQTLRCPV